jgi:hypothetical protein
MKLKRDGKYHDGSSPINADRASDLAAFAAARCLTQEDFVDLRGQVQSAAVEKHERHRKNVA